MSEAPRFRTALLLSLTVNVLLAAAVAAGLWRHAHRDEAGGGPFRMPGPAALGRALPTGDRAILHEVMRSHHGEMRPRIVDAGRARAAVRDALLAEPFDKARLDRALADVRERDTEVIAFAQGLLAEVAGKVSPEGRRAMAKALADLRGRRGHGRFGRRGFEQPADTEPSRTAPDER